MSKVQLGVKISKDVSDQLEHLAKTFGQNKSSLTEIALQKLIMDTHRCGQIVIEPLDKNVLNQLKKGQSEMDSVSSERNNQESNESNPQEKAPNNQTQKSHHDEDKKRIKL